MGNKTYKLQVPTDLALHIFCNPKPGMQVGFGEKV